ncbi:SDR family oxidoreductase [Oscillatoria sp. CS-180]|uniref:SDR family oxidoreductase n=1 Tax=Oscillatoria sp. CS-180 TaxID=3021720 RepID=UPI00232D2BF6|nr:SDR family oxidoreductase [Oscillatoria sp. CS-180]MDB9526577.1 SDR family oxidoreductase [Oscillatoria sp. CS-180]
MRSLLITGASGFLGGHACQQLGNDWQIWGTYHTQPITLTNGTAQPLDLTDKASIRTCWETVKPEAVLHLAAISKADQCQRQPDISHQVNVDGAVELAKRCAADGIPFVFASTDLIFEGTQPPYLEDDQPTPVNIYGQQKAAAEVEIATLYPDAAICRLPLLFGAAAPTANCFLQDLLAQVAAGETLNLFTDEVRTPVDAADAVRGLNLVLQEGITGLLHLGGRQRLSRYEFGLMMAQAFGFPETVIKPCLQSSVQLSAPRPKDVSLNSEQAFSLGYAPQAVEEALRAIAAA